ncbi:hypothetical protein LTS18_003264 [Coniosporium uncinatum]|uniref:Uncharacterized protein n=1 Tax=Coniosporium uncinatum TaxID=93489 RepID=A0ACC3DYR3_9PEZI|nr:hypothetical protein LTS18_003264 [Coniosporium uncinatum]
MKSWQFTALLALVIYTLVLRGIPIEHLRYSNTPASETSDTMRAFWQPILHPLLSEKFDINGKSYNRGSSLWTQPTGRRLCILDVDTRPLNDSNQLWSSGNFSWAGMPSASSGTLNHLLYASIHGYDYKFVHTQEFHDRSAYWTKIRAVANILHGYAVVVVLDSDAIFPHLQLPFEWLLNRWNFTEHRSILQATDPSWKELTNSYGRVNGNAGFLVIQNNPRSHEILRQWHGCPDDETHYPNCSRFRSDWPAEQGAFGEYLWYKYSDYVNQVACDEALGWDGFKNGCKGIFVRHYTMGKHLVKGAVEHSLGQSFMAALQIFALARGHDIRIESSSNSIVLDTTR